MDSDVADILKNPSVVFADINGTFKQVLEVGGEEAWVPDLKEASIKAVHRKVPWIAVTNNPVDYFRTTKGVNEVFGAEIRGFTTKEIIHQRRLELRPGEQPGTVSWELAAYIGCAVMSTSTVFGSADGELIFETVNFGKEADSILEVLRSFLPKLAFFEVIKNRVENGSLTFSIDQVFMDRSLVPRQPPLYPQHHIHIFDSQQKSHPNLSWIEEIVRQHNTQKVVFRLRENAQRNSTWNRFDTELRKRGLHPLYEAGDTHIIAENRTKGSGIANVYKHMPWIDPSRSISIGNSEIDLTMALYTALFIQCGNDFTYQGDSKHYLHVKSPNVLAQLLCGETAAAHTT